MKENNVMVQIKKILLTCLSMMLFQVDLSAKSLLVSSQYINADDRPTLVVHCLAGDKLRLMDDVVYGISDPKVAAALAGSKLNALVIDSTYEGGRFIFRLETGNQEFLTDDELVAALTGRGLNSDAASDRRTIEFVFLNASNTKDLCMRLQNECGIPVVMGWEGEVPQKYTVSMSFLFLRMLSLQVPYVTSFHDPAAAAIQLFRLPPRPDWFTQGEEPTMYSLRSPTLNVFLSSYFRVGSPADGFYTKELFDRTGGFMHEEPS